MNPQESNNTISEPVATKTPNNLTILAMAIFVILSLSAVIFLWYQNQQLKKMILSYQQEIQPSPTPQPVSNKKTYINTKHNYSLQIPTSFKVGFVDVIKGEFNESTGVENQVDFLPSENDEFKNFLQIQVVPSPKNATLLESINKTYKEQKEHFQTTNISAIKKSTLSGHNSYEYEFTGQALYTTSWNGVVENGQYKVIFIENGNTVYSIYLRNSDTFDQILSTFKFLDTNSDTPKPISELFNSINSNFNLSLIPKYSSEFYSFTGYIKKDSWIIDFTNTSANNKSLVTFLNTKLTLNPDNSAAGGIGGFDAYENTQIKCYFNYGYKNTNPEKPTDLYSSLTCALK